MQSVLSLLLVTVTAGLPQTAAGESATPTFLKDIAPIIFQNCTSCHRPGEAAPFALQSYTDVKKHGELIEHVVSTNLMPPWKAVPSDVRFKRERRLGDDDKLLIARWVKAGMPEGDRRDLPKLPDFPEGWQFGEPDLVLKMPEAFTVPAEGPDIYRNFVVPTNLTEERWVRAIEFRPGVPSVVHHSLFFVETRGRGRQLDAADTKPGFRGGMGALLQLRGSDSGPMNLMSGRQPRGMSLTGNSGPLAEPTFGSLGGWALGTQPHELPDGLAFHLPANADLILSTHFHPSGKVEHEASTVGLYFADLPPKQRFTGIQLPPAFGALKGIDIPAGSQEYFIEDTFELPIDVKAFGVGAHAHYLGKSMTLTATLPTGEKKTLLSIPDWDFAWQEQYDFADFVSLPKGSRLYSRITYDNSAENSRNPTQPPQRVRFGEKSTDEMGSITLMVVAANESDLPSLQTAYRDHFRESIRKAPLLELLQRRRRAE